MVVFRCCSLLIGLLYFSGCATVMGSIKASNPVRRSNIGIAAVLPFDGHDGSLFSDLIATELLSRNVALIERSRLSTVLNERNLRLQDLVTGTVDVTAVGKALGVDSLVFGSVRPIPVYISGVPSGKVAAASIRIVATASAQVLASASYNNNTDFLPGSPTYPDVATQLVQALLSRD
jgi:hypothetical protein